MLAAAATTALVAGCGGDSSLSGSTSPGSTSTTPLGAANHATGSPSLGGVDAAADLSQFTCGVSSDGSWQARGVLTDSGARPVAYRVVVVVASPTERTSTGRTRVVAARPGASTPFAISGLPAGATDATCSVQVVRAP